MTETLLVLAAVSACTPAPTSTTKRESPTGSTADTAATPSTDTGTTSSGVAPDCQVEAPAGWDRGFGWCPVTFTALLFDDGPVDQLQLVFTGSTGHLYELLYVGPAGSDRFEFPNLPLLQQDASIEYRLEVTDADGVVGDCSIRTGTGELFIQGDSDGDGYNGDYGEDCDECDDTVYAGAPELADGLDNDCNGVVDG